VAGVGVGIGRCDTYVLLTGLAKCPTLSFRSIGPGSEPGSDLNISATPARATRGASRYLTGDFGCRPRGPAPMLDLQGLEVWKWAETALGANVA